MPQDPGWELPGSSGGETSRWTVLEVRGQGNDRTYTCDVSLRGQFYGEPLGGAIAPDGHDFSLAIRGLKLRYDQLLRLSSQLHDWLSLPLPEIRCRSLALSCAMGGLFDQSLHLTLGPRDDMLPKGQLIATLEFGIGRMKGELAYPVDESCLRIMTDAIECVLEEERPDTSFRS